MPLDDIIARRITGIRPFNELPMDAEKWREAHAQHHWHRCVHNLAVHRPGIAYGLEVVASSKTERTIVIAPGMGIDSEGRTILLPEPVGFELVENRQIYIVLTYVAAKDPGSEIAVGSGKDYFREVEGSKVQATRDLPTEPYLELARIVRSGPEKPVKDAANPFAPVGDELNLLYRSLVFPRCYADEGIGELSYVPKSGSVWNPNRAGLWNLLREGSGRGFHLQFTGVINLRQPAANEPALLYVAGEGEFTPPADAELEGLQRFVQRGGMLVGEACAGGKGFETSFHALAGALGAKLKAVPKNHPLLSAQYMFGAPPPGAHPGGVLQIDEEAGIIYSTHDYGGAWQGQVERPDAPDARERIRAAQEFGLNIVAYAAQRRRKRWLAELG